MKLSWKEILRPTAVLFVICVAVAAALAGTNLLTEERIAQQAVATAEESRAQRSSRPRRTAPTTPAAPAASWWATSLRQRPAAMAAR